MGPGDQRDLHPYIQVSTGGQTGVDAAGIVDAVVGGCGRQQGGDAQVLGPLAFLLEGLLAVALCVCVRAVKIQPGGKLAHDLRGPHVARKHQIRPSEGRIPLGPEAAAAEARVDLQKRISNE